MMVNLKKIKRAVMPICGLLSLCVLWYYLLISGITETGVTNEASRYRPVNVGIVIRLYYTVLFTYAMEYLARYEHQILWHSRWLWFIHSSHHHQRTKFGSGPSKLDSEANCHISPQYEIFELNDVFPLIFATLGVLSMYWSGSAESPTLLHDVIFGSSIGISAYGTSYFIGHDLCAHARGGKSLADFLRRWSTTMEECARVHNVYHHKIDVDADANKDPYGPPYGFWLGPHEVESYKKGETDLGIPAQIKSGLIVGGLFFVFSLVS